MNEAETRAELIDPQCRETPESEAEEATSPPDQAGVSNIELVDGEKLVEMLETLELGLAPVQSYRVDHPFFDAYRS